MNKHMHRLVFDRRRGMRVAAAETARSAGKAASGATPGVVAALSAACVLTAPVGTAWAQSRSLGSVISRSGAVLSARGLAGGAPVPNLPVASRGVLPVDPSDPRYAAYLAAQAHAGQDIGSAVISQDGTQMLIKQNDQKVKINWETFDIGKGYSVHFEQPANGTAWNYVWDANPSVIQGHLTATGEIILENHNGVIFSPTARIETARFVATALHLTQDAFDKGLRAETQGAPVFTDDDLSSLNGFVSVERGAEVKALAGGDVIMVAPKVYNEGRIETTDGQAVLAAGQRVYLYESQDPAQRGLLVSVDAYTAGPDGTAASLPTGTNVVEQAVAQEYKTVNGETVDDSTPDSTPGLEKKINAIVSERGSINLVGMVVRQNGVLNATTAVKGRNGGIYLMAVKDSITGSDPVNPGNHNNPAQANDLGSVELGAGSQTTVTPALEYVSVKDPTTQKTQVVEATQTSADPFYRSRIDVVGADVRVDSGASITAPSGNVSLLAAKNYQTSVLNNSQNTDNGDDGSRLVVDAGASISVAGLRDVALPMSANQQSGRLFSIELADSPVQRDGVLYRSFVTFDARQPVSVANVNGFYNLTTYNARQLSTRGGNIRIESQGSTVVSDGATLDVSGGSVRYQAGAVTSSLLRRGDQLVRLEDAQPGVHYDELITPSLSNGGLVNTPSYVQGYDAGAVRVDGHKLYMGADLKADVVVGPYQRAGALTGSYSGINPMNGAVDPNVDDGFLDPNQAGTPSEEAGFPSVLATQPWAYASLRPRGGVLIVGKGSGDTPKSVQMLDSLTLASAGAASPGPVPDLSSTDADQFFADLPTATVLNASKLQSAGLGGLVLSANTIHYDGNLSLGASGSLNLYGANVDFTGGFQSAGGSVKLSAYRTADGTGDVTLEAGSRIDVSGTRLDETGGNAGDQAIAVNGGSVVIQAGHTLATAQGSAINVSAGVWRPAAGSVQQGQAGSISLTANATLSTDKPVNVQNGGDFLLGATLSGYDFGKGGTLTLDGIAGPLTIGSTPAATGLTLAPDFFSQHGFGTFNINAYADVNILPGTRLTPTLMNWVYAAPRGHVSGDALTQLQTLEAGLRSPVNLNLNANFGASRSNLTVGKGAVVDAGLGGSIKLRASGFMDVWGRLVAHGGSVDLGISGAWGDSSSDATASNDNLGYLPDQVLHLEDGSAIDVSGAAKTTRVAGRTTGSVLGGGQVSLDVPSVPGPVRGRVVAEAGSTIDVSGAAADLNLDGSTRLTHVSAGAGTVQIGSTEGFALMGTIRAFRPDGSVGGGQFIASLSQGGSNSQVSGGAPYPDADRILNVLNTADEVQAAATGASSYGQGFVSAQSLLGSGFDRIALKADHAIALGAGVDLKQTVAQAASSGPLRSVQLDTPLIQSLDDQSHAIQAQYVALGNKDVPIIAGQSYSAPLAQGSATASNNSLTVNAGLIETYGHSAFVGFDNVNLNATLDAKGGAARTDGEVRFIGTGYESFGANANLTGGLDFARTLNITAGQAYATTLSDFTVQGDGSSSVLNIFGPGADHAGSTSRTPLSALAQLHLDAPTVNIDGTIRQPFGAITVGTAATPVAATFGPHSLLSVSGDGTAVPVGNTVDQVQWVYATDGSNNAANFSSDNAVQSLNSLPVTKGIAVNGNGSLTIDPAARVQAQAGGDLLAWEFITGVGGSTDTLTRKNVFAVLPGYAYSFAPYDTEIQASTAADGTTLAAGSQVTVTTPNGILAPGTYTLLPARYAILPGAVLVSAQTIGTTQTLGKPVQQDDGSAYVSGSLGAVGTAINGGNDPRVVLALEPEATFRAKSTLLTSSINQFLTTQAQRYNSAVGALPGDAGRVSLASTNPFDWDAQYNLGGAKGFAGGEFDLSMPKIALVSQGETAPDGYAAVSAQSLNATGAQSVLLGGVRSGAGDQTVVTTTADDVQIGSGSGASTTLGVNELIAVAKDHVDVAAGASVASPAADASLAPRQITVQGDGAALVVSDNANLDLRRDLGGVSGTGAAQISVAAGAQLKGANVQVDASKAVALDAAARIDAQTFGLGAPKLAIGGPSDDPSAVVVQGDLLNRLVQSTQLQLRGYQGMDWVGSVNFNALAADGAPHLQSVVLDTPQMRGLGGAGDVVTIAAKSVTLRNTSGTTVSGGSGQSQLVIQAQPPVQDGRTGGLTLGEGAQHLAFADTTLQSSGDIVLSGQGQVSTQGDATLSAARVTADSTANYAVTSGGVLTVTQPTGAHTLGEHVGAGAVVNLSGQRVVQDGVIDLPSGQVTLSGSGQSGRADTVVFTARSTTRAAGWVAAATSSVAHTDGGVVAPGGSITASAAQGNVEVYGTLDVSAPTPVSSTDTGAAAGTIELSATGSGDAAVVLGSAAKLLGQSGTGSDASLNGSLKIDAQYLANGGADAGAAQAQANLDRVAQLAGAGHFNNDIEVRVRQGDQSLSQTLQATRVILAADQGGMTLASGGAIDASAPAGGVVQVSAGKDLVMQDGFTLDAHSSRAGANGGDVLLASTAGRVSLQGGSIDTHGDDAQDGRVVVRATRNDAASSDADRVQIDPIQATVTAGEFDVEAVRRYTAADLVDNGAAATNVLIDTNVQNQLWNDSSSFLSHSAGVLSALGAPAGAQLRSGVEIDSTGDITVANDWTLSAKGGSTLATPTMLSLRAAGNLNLNGTLSDGFATAGRAALTATTPTAIVGAGASMRLVAGADLGAANVLQTQAPSSSGTGNLSVAATKMVRTTSGSIEMAAAGDVQLQTDAATHPTSSTQAVVYVAGGPSGALPDGSSFDASAYRWAQYTAHGGRLEVSAGRDIVAPAPSQLFNNWFYHGASAAGAKTVTWFSSLDSFKQGLGSFGGGNVRVTAGGDIRNLGVVAPTSARNLTLADGSLSLLTENGGDILVKAGGNIAGGDYFLGRGQGRIQAGGAITTGDSISASLPAVGPVLGLMDGHWTLQANDDLNSSFVYNPTMLSSSSTRMPVSLTGGYFTYGVDSGVSMSSVRGALNFDTSAIGTDASAYLTQILKAYSPTVEQDNLATSSGLLKLNQSAASVAPPQVRLQALSGDVNLTVGSAKGLWAFPSPQAYIDIYAGQNLNLSTGVSTSSYIGLLDGDPTSWPNPSQPIQFSGKALLNSATSGLPLFLYGSDVSNLPSGTLHASNAPLQWYAGGNLTDSNVKLVLPQAASIVAGGDIAGLLYTGQNNSEADVTQIAAGGSIKPFISSDGSQVQGFAASLYGPGTFNIYAGRQLDLSHDGKITAVGQGGSNEPVISAVNPALPDESAHVNVAAGLAQTLNVDPFLDTFLQASALSPADDLHGLAPSSTDAKAQAVYEAALQSNAQRKALAALLDAQAAAARAELKSYVQSTLHLSDAAFSTDTSVAYGQAVAYFKQLTPQHQAEFAHQVMQQAFVSLYLGAEAGAGGIPSYLDAWKTQASAAGVADDDYASTAFQNFEKGVLMNEIKRAGTLASSIADSTNDAENSKRKALRADLWNQVAVITDLTGLGRSFSSVGDINLSGGTIQTTAPGDLTHGGIDLFAPGGQVLVGLSVADPLNAERRGLVTQQGGSIRSYSQGDFQVNAQKVFVVNQGDLIAYSSNGNIDSGRGANTDVTVSVPKAQVQPDGTVKFVTVATTGSGLGILGTQDAQYVLGLYAPNGEVRALDAYIVGPTIQVASPVVKGADNLKSGTGQVFVAPPSVSVNVNTGTQAQSSEVAQTALANANGGGQKVASSLLTVDLIGLGADPTAAGPAEDECDEERRRKGLCH